MNIYIFKDFVLQGVIVNKTALEWIRKYNSLGEFTLTLPFNKEAFELLKLGNIVYKQDTMEAGRINSHKITTDSEGKETLLVSGYFVAGILKDRTFSYTGSGYLSNIITNIINLNFINPTNSNRKINGFRITSLTITDPIINIEFKNKNVYELLEALALQYNFGFGIKYNIDEKTYDFYMYEGQLKNVVFTKQYNNVLEQDYYYSLENYKNACIIENIVVGDDNIGLDRKEVATEGSASTGSTLAEQAMLFLQQFKAIETFDAVIDPNSMQFNYREEWDLGDIVLCRNTDYGASVHKNIVQVTEYYDLDDLHLTVLFGNYIPTLKQQIKRGV